MVPDDALKNLWEKVKSPRFEDIQNAVDDLIAEGYPVKTLFTQLCGHIAEHAELSDAKKARLALALAVADKKLVDGANEYMQLLNIASTLHAVCSSA